MAVSPPPLTLCAHASLAHGLHSAYDERQRAAGCLSWPTAPILTLDAWLERLWAACGDRMLLTRLQEQVLWHQIIAAHAAGRELLDLDATAAAAAAAWRLAQQWDLPLTGEAWQEREETAAFLAWAGEFQRLCRRGEWLSAAELPTAAAARLPPAGLPPAMHWAGFDELTPQLQQLRRALRAAGVSIEEIEAPGAEASLPGVTRFADPGSELQAVAAWARAIVEQDPAARVGIVVPGLAACRIALERIFLEVFHSRRAPWDDAPRAFHLSLAPLLTEVPAIAAALRWVEFFSTHGLVETSAALDWIRSPFLAASDTEAAARARLGQAMRRQQRELWRWPDLARLLAPRCPALAAGLRGAHALVRRWPRRQGHQAWAESWAQLWQALGWPGERPLDIGGWPTIAAWQRLLDDFGRLDQVAPAPLDCATALARLRRAAARPYPPQAAPTPVQILDWREASGLEFSHLWVCGLDEQALPAPPHPHPFLPLALQRERNLPHVSAAREAEVAQRVWRRLRAGSPVVQASFAAFDAEGRPQLPSPLLAGLSHRPHHAAPASAPSVILETLDDHLAPPAAAAERCAGSELFRDQAACPFRAFAHLRLHARAAPALVVGLPATVRGALLHRVLRDLWAEPGAGDFSPARIDRLAAAAVAGERRLAGQAGLAAAERARLAATVREWCAIERRRRPFRVLQTEAALTAAFAGLELHLRRDRIDELAGGSLAVLDYKSGECSPGAWAGPYPEQPQLPLYLVTEPRRAQVAAIAFAQLRTGDMTLAGVERAPGTLLPEPLPHPQWMPSWEDQLVRWDDELHALAEEYLHGEARVEPRQRESCTYCDLHALCRIRERLPRWTCYEGGEGTDADLG